jgi:nitrate reductase (cytochrome), electron transfer subunit
MKRTNMLGLTVLLACALLTLHAVRGPAPVQADDTAGPAPGVTDAMLGLSKTSVFDVPVPPPVGEDATDPGERGVLPRPYPESPPRIPHAIADFEPITRQANGCLDCHQLGGAKAPGEPVPLPPSHVTDLRNAPGTVGTELVGARYNCNSCHVSDTGAPPLVGNRFAAP